MTLQISDSLVWNDKNYSVCNLGLSLTDCFPSIEFPKFKSNSSACWRGYVATWKIDCNGWLKLIFLGVGDKEETSPEGETYTVMFAADEIGSIFPNSVGGVIALGFTGDVLVRYCDGVRDESGVLTFDYVVLNISKGRLVDFKNLDCEQGAVLDSSRRRTSERLKRILAGLEPLERDNYEN